MLGGPLSVVAAVMSVDQTVVTKVARLSRLALDQARIPVIVAELNAVLSLIDQLGDAQLAHVSPLLNPLDATLELRADFVSETDRSEDLQRCAPQVSGGYYLVPRVME
jgi:aspartyl-tRNA(Asn)/glutamyl-tRNA(Gln) amidotransferase subunit C